MPKIYARIKTTVVYSCHFLAWQIKALKKKWKNKILLKIGTNAKKYVDFVLLWISRFMDQKCTHFTVNTLVTSNKYVQCKWRKEFEWHLQRPKSFLGRRRKKTLRRWVFPDALIKKTYTAGGVESVQFRKCDHYAAARCVWHSCPQRRPKYRAHPSCVSLSF